MSNLLFISLIYLLRLLFLKAIKTVDR